MNTSDTLTKKQTRDQHGRFRNARRKDGVEYKPVVLVQTQDGNYRALTRRERVRSWMDRMVEAYDRWNDRSEYLKRLEVHDMHYGTDLVGEYRRAQAKAKETALRSQMHQYV